MWCAKKKAIAFQKKKFFKPAQGMDGSKSGKSSYYTHKSQILSDIILRYSYKSGSTAACTLFRNKRFELNKMFQQNASKCAIFYV